MHFLNGNHHDRFVMVQALTSVYEKSGRLCFGLSAIGLSSDFQRVSRLDSNVTFVTQ